jgi:hypothetical protein
MAHVTVRYEMFLPAGHHRQPRNADALLDLAPAAGADVPNPGSYTPPFFPQLPYTISAGSGLAQLMFWSVTDGTTGEVKPPSALTQTVGSLPLQIGAWYYPVTGPGGGGGGTAIIVDAFSAKLGGFIDDTFVDVTNHPSLTSNANVVGVVPTTAAEILKAKTNVVSTTEPFRQWVRNSQPKLVGDTTLNVAKGGTGIAVAIYQNKEPPNRPDLGGWVEYDPFWWIKTHGGLTDPNPPDWLVQLHPLFSLALANKGMTNELQVQALELGLKQLSAVSSAVKAEIRALQAAKAATAKTASAKAASAKTASAKATSTKTTK